MMFVHALLFLLLGTSVVALPVDHPPNQSPHSPSLSPAGQGQHSLDSGRRQRRKSPKPAYQVINPSNVEKGQELEPGLVPDSFRGRLGIESSQQTLMLDNFEKYAGLWYREPTNVSRISLTFTRISVYLT
jgi:hypothetical protein